MEIRPNGFRTLPPRIRPVVHMVPRKRGSTEMAPSRPSIIRLPSLTGYRAVLFLAVYLTHALGAARFFRSTYADTLGTIAPYGTAALSSFFVLSGFVLPW